MKLIFFILSLISIITCKSQDVSDNHNFTYSRTVYYGKPVLKDSLVRSKFSYDSKTQIFTYYRNISRQDELNKYQNLKQFKIAIDKNKIEKIYELNTLYKLKNNSICLNLDDYSYLFTIQFDNDTSIKCAEDDKEKENFGNLGYEIVNLVKSSPEYRSAFPEEFIYR